ncbi:phage tail protein I [Sphingomonas hylomeconis]|uniref:Phage tail protein I n=1 Tax=Sphingomonas hylomeconis TaxID=1395958 RepID=A0ABV7ST79_9SPHN|nr:phage tail protein I [Sphingomonas hylomeconis]
MANSLLPPNATPLERALVDATARDSDVPDLLALWNPETCPIALLPWLAWGLSIDRWDPEWSEDEKRAAVASAIEDQRLKGTRYSIERVLASFDALLELVEWFEVTPNAAPYTFEVRLPVIDAAGVAGGGRTSAAVARAIVTEVSRTKPARAHFQLVQQLRLAGMPAPIAALQATNYRRLHLAATDGDAGTPWADLLQDQNGEPLEFGDTGFIDGSAP